MNQRSFGRKTEQAQKLGDAHQMTIFEVFNEPEILSDNSPEPEITEIVVSSHTRKKKSKREDNLDGLPVETYKRLAIIPQTFMFDEHHVHIYASKSNDGTIV